mmetsp:Transcript_16437/g.27846  ORF Transcript_16437/g.27846 Transcript_16437/m.27846 type:complete len:177 (-) Transcript_16437:227-757(-)
MDTEQATQLVQAARRAIDLVEEYSECDPYNKVDKSNPWNNPEEMFAKLDAARNDVMAAWTEKKSGNESLGQDNNNEKQNELDDDGMRAVYLDMITDAFADVLDTLRQEEGGNLDVDVLVDCLQTGMDLLSSDEKELLMEEQEESHSVVDDDDDHETSLTPHEKRRIDLGFVVPVQS